MQKTVASFCAAVHTARQDLIRLARGEQDGMPTWYYVRVEKTKFAMYLQKMKRGETLNVYDYGEVLYSGWGENPPAHITEKIYEEYDDAV